MSKLAGRFNEGKSNLYSFGGTNSFGKCYQLDLQDPEKKWKKHKNNSYLQLYVAEDEGDLINNQGVLMI